jgi:hypothetical protein
MSGNDRDGILNREQIFAADEALSRSGKFRYTLRNLYYYLQRKDVIPVRKDDPLAELERFKQALQEYETSCGPLPGRIRRAELPPEPDVSELHADVMDYTVRRILVFDRVEPFLLFALNGFHRKLEIGLLIWPDYPRHAWRMHERQPGDGPRRTFYLLHDCNRSGYELRPKVRRVVDSWGLNDKVVDLGLRFRQAGNLGLTIQKRRAGGDSLPEDFHEADFEEARLLLYSGNFVHLEEMSPLRMMRWAYRRIAKRSQQVGFG